MYGTRSVSDLRVYGVQQACASKPRMHPATPKLLGSGAVCDCPGCGRSMPALRMSSLQTLCADCLWVIHPSHLAARLAAAATASCAASAKITAANTISGGRWPCIVFTDELIKIIPRAHDIRSANSRMRRVQLIWQLLGQVCSLRRWFNRVAPEY